MEITLNIPDFDPKKGFQYHWNDNFVIKTEITDSKEIIISANKEGLISLANHLLNLAQSSVPINHHIHLDEYNSLEELSNELIIQKIK